MKRNKFKKGKKKPGTFSKLSLFQRTNESFTKTCPLSIKGAPVVDYKNVKLLKKYISDSGKILPSRITSVSQKKQKELSIAIKRARFLSLMSYTNKFQN